MYKRQDEEFPFSSYNDDGLKSKINFLNFIRNDVELIQDRIYVNLITVPDEPGIRMLKTEVSQALYSTIIGYNPSRFVGDLMPVESVNWKEANDFCKRYLGLWDCECVCLKSMNTVQQLGHFVT